MPHIDGKYVSKADWFAHQRGEDVEPDAKPKAATRKRGRITTSAKTDSKATKPRVVKTTSRKAADEVVAGPSADDKAAIESMSDLIKEKQDADG